MAMNQIFTENLGTLMWSLAESEPVKFVAVDSAGNPDTVIGIVNTIKREGGYGSVLITMADNPNKEYFLGKLDKVFSVKPAHYSIFRA